MDVDDFRKLFRELTDEIDFIAKPFPDRTTGKRKYPAPSAISAIERRLLVRSIFSCIEAMVFTIKLIALIKEPSNLSPSETAFAKEEDYQLEETGQIKTLKSKLGFRSNFRFAFRIAAKSTGADYALNVSCQEWEAMIRALKVRHRLTHPKKASDLEVTDDETSDTLLAFDWAFMQMTILAASSLLKYSQERAKNSALESPPKSIS